MYFYIFLFHKAFCRQYFFFFNDERESDKKIGVKMKNAVATVTAVPR